MGRQSRKQAKDADLKEIQRVKIENQKLRGQIASLRKQLSRIDIDRYTNLKEIIEAHDKQDKEFNKKQELKDLKDKWICHKCNEDHLKLIMIPRLDGLFYIRRCASCTNKTKMKRYVEGVEG